MRLHKPLLDFRVWFLPLAADRTFDALFEDLRQKLSGLDGHRRLACRHVPRC